MKNIIFIILLFHGILLLGQNRFPENENPSNITTGVYYQKGPGSTNTLLIWLYPYVTKLTVFGESVRNFELIATSHPLGELKLRQWNPYNNAWTSWRQILVANENFGIETGNTTGNKLAVKGKFRAEEIKV
ncbi:hypothetical protein HZY62_21685 [Maribacter polysiphoniae]|uniref:Uncharacterized protein n=1 Tax=Maribacter polysiphoniae TaxID=429344 RepID=A0A316E3M2_9FLAO|nr:hypothetical protein [Maribacter polysiphoniae]MBD1263213.1 hypothetical protein [Maribacter polysiphoniae]PWK17490.1 hypothetical protein LX92_04437 [Maribacter polysiphoniae]